MLDDRRARWSNRVRRRRPRGDQAMGSPSDWASGSPTTVSGRLRKAGVSERKCRLFCAACCRAAQRHIKHGPCLDLLALVEEWAEEPGLAAEVRRLRGVVSRWARAIHVGA